MGEAPFGVDDVAEMETSFGAVALIDVLGFKSIRRANDHQKVVRALVSARDTLTGIAAFVGEKTEHQLRVACFSDTIIATVQGPPDPGILVRLLSRSLKAFLYRAVTDPHRIPMVYRGCITVGELAVGGEFMVGDAVDDAAQWYERSDAAIVWLTPRAAAAVPDGDFSLVRWPVQLKEAGALETFAVSLAPPNVIELNDSPENLQALQELYARPFGGALPRRVRRLPSRGSRRWRSSKRATGMR